ncbi:MAG: helix-turn-helix domain-containing protein [Eubacterium sp.]|nr:helix-turn-helix domain-containing protein [Eubacterium sp.]
MIDFHIIGKRIKYYRKIKGITQAQVADALDVSVSYISQIERGVAEVSLSRLDEIANIIHAKIENLVADTDENSEQYLNSELFQLIKRWEPQKRDLLVRIATAMEDF